MPIIYPALSMAFSPDGARLAAATRHTVHIWDAQTGESLAELGTSPTPEMVMFSPDGSRLAVASGIHGRVDLFDTQTWELVASSIYFGHRQGIMFSGDGELLALVGPENLTEFGGIVQIRDAETGQIITKLEHTTGVWAVAFSPDSAILAVGSVDGQFWLWDTVTAEKLASYEAHSAPMLGLRFSPDGARIVTMSADDVVRIWGVPADR